MRESKRGWVTMTIEQMERIFTNEIPLEGLAVDSGIWEFHIENDKSIGISYENIDGRLVYIFNLFVRYEYINISGEYESVYDALENVTNEWNKWQ